MPKAARASWGRLSAAVMALGLGAFVVTSLGPSVQPVVAASCEPGVEIDGVLRCPPATALRDACGELHVLRAGDRIDRASCIAPTRLSGPELAALAIAVDVNHAGPPELASLPGVGPVLAQRIVAGRPYASVDALREVSGIGPVTLAAMRDRVVLGAPPGSAGSSPAGR